MPDSSLSGGDTALVAIVLVISLAALGFAAYLVKAVLAADQGTVKMREIALAVQEGAAAYLKRQFRTLGIFVSTLLEKAGGKLPQNFVVTLPKITAPEQVTALADIFDLLEKKTGLAAGSLKMEMMIETTQSIINSEGRINLPLLLQAARGRCVAAHFGTYDYTASCSITAAHQHMMHPSCDFAKHMMQVSFAGTGIWLSDGATNIMPVPPHKFTEGGRQLTPQQIEENVAAVEVKLDDATIRRIDEVLA